MLWILSAKVWWGTSTALQQLSRQSDPFKQQSGAVREQYFRAEHVLLLGQQFGRRVLCYLS